MTRSDVMIGSSVIDLPSHREAAITACLRHGLVPSVLDVIPAETSDLVTKSLEMVDEAEAYIGILGFRYGFVPPGYEASLFEIEYNRAEERGIPILTFFMDIDHPLTPNMFIEGLDDPAQEAVRKVKLTNLKKRITASMVVREFKSPEELRKDIFDALANANIQRKQNFADLHSALAQQIPTLPEPYIAHPYSLLETKNVIGRQMELNLLTRWISGKHPQVGNARILSVVSVGGMGKSALTWKWFNDIAPNERPDLKGRLWWSFYESDAGWENFILRALAYVTGRDEEDIRKNTKPGERGDTLLGILDREPYLLALDGLERILIAYTRMDAAHMDDLTLDKNNLQLRKTADTRAGVFLRRLASLRASRNLITTRLRLADLETNTRDPLPGTYAYELRGLSDDDAVTLWREFNVSGTQEELLRLFHTFENYPLLIRALAAEVANFRRAPRDFDAWRKANPDFDPFQSQYLQMNIAERKSYVFKYTLQGLTAAEKRVLETVAAFRMPATFDTLAALLVKPHNTSPLSDSGRSQEGALFASESELDTVLYALEDRGLVGWDRAANRYDLHPIVRGVTWSRLGEIDRRGVYSALQGHFQAVPDKFNDWQNVERFEDLTPAIALYQALIGLGRYEDACDVFYDRLEDATLYRLSVARQRVELLEQLFPDGTDHLPRLSKPSSQGYTLNSLALAYKNSGEPGRAAPLYRRYVRIAEESDDNDNASIGLRNLASALYLSGFIHDAEGAAQRGLFISRAHEDHFREAVSLYWLGLVLAVCGHIDRSELALQRSLVSFQKQDDKQSEGLAQAFRAQAAVWRSDPQTASLLADRAWELAHHARYERDFIQSARLSGAAALGLNNVDRAEERLHHALGRARAVNWVEEELPALIGLAELARRRGQLDAARDLLNDVWEPAKRGPYPLLHADAFNELAAVERAAGNQAAAIEAATQAYTYAWCDGISADGSVCYAYAPGLRAAKAHLDALGAAYPALPPFDESKFEPLPAVEINPEDAYWVDPATVEEI